MQLPSAPSHCSDCKCDLCRGTPLGDVRIHCIWCKYPQQLSSCDTRPRCDRGCRRSCRSFVLELSLDTHLLRDLVCCSSRIRCQRAPHASHFLPFRWECFLCPCLFPSCLFECLVAPTVALRLGCPSSRKGLFRKAGMPSQRCRDELQEYCGLLTRPIGRCQSRGRMLQ